jgi:hypothetical protein
MESITIKTKKTLDLIKKPSTPIKKQLVLEKRKECPILGGNMWLIGQLFEYLTMGERLKIMMVNYDTYKLFRGNNRYWYRMWHDRKYSKPLGYNIIHIGPIKYGCIKSDLFYHSHYQALKNKIMDPLLKDTELSEEDKNSSSLVFTSYYPEPKMILDKGKLKTMKNKDRCRILRSYFACCQARDNNYRNEIIDNEHWSIREVYPLEYYGKEYDPETDYYKEIMLMDNPKKIQAKINNHKNKMIQIQHRLNQYKRAYTYEEYRLKKEETEIEKLQLILDINTLYTKQ